MNCKFCGNLMPETADSCPVCGRRQDEQPIGKLLSENMPNPVAAEEQRSEAQRRSTSSSGESAQKKSLIPPVVAIALAVLGWFYGITQNFLETIKTIFNGSFGEGTALASNSDFVAGGSTASTDLSAIGFVGVVVILLTIIGIIGIIALVKRLINNLKK